MSDLIQIENDQFPRSLRRVAASSGIPKPPRWPIWASTRCSIAGRNPPASFRATGANCTWKKAWAWCRKFFTPEVLARLPGDAALGHTRYSTAGDTSLMNAQPIVIDCNKGKLALGHNGNLTNAGELRRTLEHRGSIFQTTSDTEVIVHLIARSQARNLSGALADALNQVEGAYSLLVLTRDEMYAHARSARLPPAGARAPRRRVGGRLRKPARSI